MALKVQKIESFISLLDTLKLTAHLYRERLLIYSVSWDIARCLEFPYLALGLNVAAVDIFVVQ
jgi:hypothetical protein